LIALGLNVSLRIIEAFLQISDLRK